MSDEQEAAEWGWWTAIDTQWKALAAIVAVSVVMFASGAGFERWVGRFFDTPDVVEANTAKLAVHDTLIADIREDLTDHISQGDGVSAIAAASIDEMQLTVDAIQSKTDQIFCFLAEQSSLAFPGECVTVLTPQ